MATAHLCISLGPLSVYLMLMGLINASRKPFVTSGARDIFSLALGVSGLVMIGPLRLFVPEQALTAFGAWTWALLGAFYILSVLLIGMTSRPRLVVYNITATQLKTSLGILVAELDKTAKWAGDSVELPQLGIQLSIESKNTMRSCQIVAVGHSQNLANWARLRVKLAASLKKINVSANPYALSMIGFALVLGTLIAFQIIQNPQIVLNDLRDFLRL
ncbi:MAG: hypothetical protein CMJ76_12485 [Planctomycetaceae bacterium]|nr:hypothetical protein [Planctomycetaceae bacterium]|tara:strand:- start:1049 stop:1699 length:651 start_codon:yes stop_codon:yes gene_type:complete